MRSTVERPAEERFVEARDQTSAFARIRNLARTRGEYVTIPLVFVLFVGTWEALVRGLDIPAYLVPPPSAVVGAIVAFSTSSSFWNDFTVTAREAVFGFAFATVLAIFLGVLVSTLAIVRKTLLPYIVGWHAIPTLPLAPIIVVWFGHGEISKVIVAAIISFFPLFMNIVDGLDSSDRAQIDMARVFGASATQVFVQIRVRNALPYFFTGLSISAVLAILGAVVAEWIGATAGLGNLLLALHYNFRIADMFAVLGYIAALGIAAHLIVRILRHRVVFWERLGGK